MLIRTRIAQLPALKSSGQNADLGTEKNKFRGQSCTKSEALINLCHLNIVVSCFIRPSFMTLLEKRMRGLNRDLSAAVSKVLDDAKPKSVHRLRTTVRRIESLVSYANPDIGKKEERTLEKMADLRKRAGKLRDLD